MEFVMREKTFNDHAIDELAKVNASCILRLQYGRCKFSDCNSCSLYKKRNICYNSMNNYDRARLKQRIGKRYAMLSINPELHYSANRLLAFCFIGLIVTIAFFVASIVMAMCNSLIGFAITSGFGVGGLSLTVFDSDWWQALRNGLCLKKSERIRR